MQFHLILFYTEGKKLDEGIDMTSFIHQYYQKAMPFFDRVHIYCPRKLIEKNQAWKEIFSNQSLWMEEKCRGTSVAWSENWASLNFSLWKPYLLYEILEQESSIDENDIIFYHDSNYVKYPEYALGIKKWKKWVTDRLYQKSVLLFNDDNLPLGNDTKHELIIKYLDPGDEIKHHIWAGAIAFKKISLH